MSNSRDLGSYGTSALTDTGVDTDNVPLAQSVLLLADAGTAATLDTGTAAGELPTNADLATGAFTTVGTASTANTGVTTGTIPFAEDVVLVDAGGNADIAGTVTADGLVVAAGTYGTLLTAGGTNGYISVSNPSENLVTAFTGTSDVLALGTSNTERMRITSDGKIGIGTASPTQAFSLVSTQNNNAAASILHNGSVIGNQYGLAVSTADDQNDTTRYFFIGIGGTTARFKVLSNGNVQNSNNSYGALSDQKLKENIADCASQWEDLKAVRLRNYSMISDRETSANRLGVIAQELEAAGMGGLVDESDDLDEKNESIGTTTKSVKYSILYMKAVGALQEAQTRIESLEELTQSLITRIEILEAK